MSDYKEVFETFSFAMIYMIQTVFVTGIKEYV